MKIKKGKMSFAVEFSDPNDRVFVGIEYFNRNCKCCGNTAKTIQLGGLFFIVDLTINSHSADK